MEWNRIEPFYIDGYHIMYPTVTLPNKKDIGFSSALIDGYNITWLLVTLTFENKHMESHLPVVVTWLSFTRNVYMFVPVMSYVITGKSMFTVLSNLLVLGHNICRLYCCVLEFSLIAQHLLLRSPWNLK